MLAKHEPNDIECILPKKRNSLLWSLIFTICQSSFKTRLIFQPKLLELWSVGHYHLHSSTNYIHIIFFMLTINNISIINKTNVFHHVNKAWRANK